MNDIFKLLSIIKNNQSKDYTVYIEKLGMELQ